MISLAEHRRMVSIGKAIAFLALANSLAYLFVIWNGRSGEPRPLSSISSTARNHGADSEGGEQKVRSHPIAFEKQSVELGQCYEGDVVHHTYRFTNKGRSPVRVLSVTGSCACTVGKYTEGLVPASSSGSVAVEVKTAGKEGYFQGRVAVTFDNNGAKFAIPLSLSVNVMTPGKLAAHPTSINLGDVDSGQVIRKSVSLTVGQGLATPLKILKVNHPDFITASLREAKSGEYSVDLVMVAPALKGELLGFVEILTSSPRYPKMTLPVTGRVRGKLNCEPRSLVKIFSTGEKGQGEGAEFVMSRSDRAEFSIRKIRVEPNDECIRVVDGGGDLKTRRFMASFVSSKEGDKVKKGDIYVECSYDGMEEVVRVPFLFIKK